MKTNPSSPRPVDVTTVSSEASTSDANKDKAQSRPSSPSRLQGSAESAGSRAPSRSTSPPPTRPSVQPATQRLTQTEIEQVVEAIAQEVGARRDEFLQVLEKESGPDSQAATPGQTTPERLGWPMSVAVMTDNPYLRAAKSLSTSEPRTTHPAVVEGMQAATEFVETGRLPALTGVPFIDSVFRGMASAVQSVPGRVARLPGAAAGAAQALPAQAERAAQALQAALPLFLNSDFVQGGTKVAKSVAHVTARNVLAVFVPTFLRQLLEYGIEKGFHDANASPMTKTLMGLAVPTAATVSLALGAMRDEVAGTATPASRKARAIMALTTFASGVAAAATVYTPKDGNGQWTSLAADNASLLLSRAAYTTMRDLVVQSRLRLNNPNTEGIPPNRQHWQLISMGYGIDQALGSWAFDQAAPSGAAAFRQGLPPQYHNDLLRAVFNLLGEVGEDLMFQSIPAFQSQSGRSDRYRPHTLELNAEDVGYQQQHLANGAMGPWAVRTGILATGLSLSALMGHHTRNAGDLVTSERFVQAANALLNGILNGVLYWPFAVAGSAQPNAAHYQHLAEALERFPPPPPDRDERGVLRGVPIDPEIGLRARDAAAAAARAHEHEQRRDDGSAV